jgi:uncharacterized membrane protein
MAEAIQQFFLETVGREWCVFFCSMIPIIELRGAVPMGWAMGLEWWQTYIISVLGNMLPVPFILLFIRAILRYLTKSRVKLFSRFGNWLMAKVEKNKGKIIRESAEKKHLDESVGKDALQESVDGGCADRSVEKPIEVAEFSQSAEEQIDKNSAQTDEKSAAQTEREMSIGVFIALMIFVAIPFPGTGAWTGSLVAALFNLPKRRSFLAVTLGVLISGIVMCLASYGTVGFLKFLV